MATTNRNREAIFSRLDEIFSGGATTNSTATYTSDNGYTVGATNQQISDAKKISANTSDKAYRRLMAHKNVTSYSKLNLLHTCPRLFELEILKQNVPVSPLLEADGIQKNLDFAFGHAVGSGIQAYAATGSLVAAQLAAWLAWKAPYDAEKTDARGNPTGKSLTWALYAVEKFAWFYQNELSDWEVLILPNGKAAVELAFAVNTQNGYYHFGHIDTVLRHRRTGRLAVWEGKTTGFETVKDAAYANSYQALGYSVVVDAVAHSLGFDSPDYEVLYIVYSSKSREFQLLPFTKNKTQRAEWLQDLLLNHAMISKYSELGFFPKRGESCINKYGRQCEYFGSCHMRNESIFPGITLPELTDIHGLESVDFSFTLDQLIAAQTHRA
jgi:hypothetical protein